MVARSHNSRGRLPEVSFTTAPLLTSPAAADNLALHNLPLDLLHAELQRRQDDTYKPSCGSSEGNGTYRTSLHVFALFLILILSTLGQSPPSGTCSCLH